MWVAVTELNSSCYNGEPHELLYIPVLVTLYSLGFRP